MAKPNLFQQLTRLFRNGPTISRKVRGVDSLVAVEGPNGEGVRYLNRTNSPGNTAYVVGYPSSAPHERLARLQDFIEMDSLAEVSSALDIYADESVSSDLKGRSFHIYSNNPKIKKELDDLFYNRMNVEFNLRPWVRNLPVRKDTIIPLLDGRNITIEELAKEHKEGKENWVYSVQEGTSRTVPGKISWCDLTRSQSELVRIWLDDQSYVDCTPDHEWILRDGSKKKAIDLESGQSLMPFYRKLSDKKNGDNITGYEKVYDPMSNRFVYTHRRVGESLPIAEGDEGDKIITHHVNFNKLDNSPQNLRRMDSKKHWELHSEISYRLLQRPEVVAKRTAGFMKYLKSVKHSNMAREHLKVLQEQGLMKTSWTDYNKSDLYQKHMPIRLAATKKLWNEKREELIESFTIKFDQKCLDLMTDKIIASKSYVRTADICKMLLNDSSFMNYFVELNSNSGRDLKKSFTATSINNFVKRLNYSTYMEYYKEKVPSIVSDWRWRKAVKISDAKTKKKNHKVSHVEKLSTVDDVYCMEVINPFDGDKHDRHNFMILSKDANGNVTNSGICSSNCKYGDGFFFINVSMDDGVISVTPMPVHEIVREEAFDGNPTSVRFKWAGQQNKSLENWEVAHIRLMGSDTFFPYGTSMLDGSRRIWRQLIMCEDAMLVYRISRSPERRVFYIDVGNIPSDDVANYMEQAKNNIVSACVVDKATGKLDQRFAPLSILEDYYLPTRGGETGTRIDTLQAGNNTAAIEDVAYLQKKLIGALKVPAAYLGYSELLGSKSSLSAEDVRFSRTVQMIQKTVISELNKIAMIHLFSLGFREDDLTNFSLHLSNPSAIAQQQKLELFRTRFEIAGTVPEGFLSKRYIYKNILDMTDDEVLNNKRELLEDATAGQAVEAAGLGAGGEDAAAGEGDDTVGAEPAAEEPGVETAGEFERDGELLISDDDDYTDDEIDEMEAQPFVSSIDNKSKSSVKLAPGIKKYMHNRRRQIKRSQQHDPFRGFRTESLAEQLGYTSEEHLDEDTIQQKKQLDNAITVLPCLGIQEMRELDLMRSRLGFRNKLATNSSDLLTEKLNINEDDNIVEIDNLDEVVLYDNLENELVKKFTNNG